jgi:hypothetical protein
MLCGVPQRTDRTRHRLAVTSAFLLALVATVAATVHESAQTGRPKASASSTASAKPRGSIGTKLQFGLDYSDTLTWKSASALNASLQDAENLGAQYVRVDLAWEDYQSTSAAFAPDFTRFDRVVSAANAHGLKILATVDFPPVWARESSCSPVSACPPAEDSQYAEFAAKAAARYAPQGVHDWEIWNEPNIPSWSPGPDPAAYAKLLSKTAQAIHAVDSQAYVMMGGLAAQQPHPGIPYLSPADFIVDVAKDGGFTDVQAVAYHPYPGQPDAMTSSTIEAIDSSPDNIVSALSRSGHPKLAVWITETGSSVPFALEPNASAAKIAQQEDGQALAATNLVSALAHTPDVAAMFWFDDEDLLSQRLVYGLHRADGTARPAFAALKKAISANRGG